MNIIDGYVKLGIAALLPVIVAILFRLLEDKTAFGRLRFTIKQLIIGIAFGCLAIIGTEWGIKIGTATVNARDAAPLIAGLFFGGPAGILAGVIGGVERWIAVAWGIGSYTRVACSVSTCLAGFLAAALRKFIFNEKDPNIAMAFATGLIMEVFHLSMVFITNIGDATNAANVVKACATPMITFNAVSVMLASLILTLIKNRKADLFERKNIQISTTMQRWMLVTVFIAFVLTTFFMFGIQSGIAIDQSENLIKLTISDITTQVNAASDNNLLEKTKSVYKQIGFRTLDEICDNIGVAEIYLVDRNGFIYNSNVTENIGFDMSSTEQSSEFLCLLESDGPSTYVQSYQTMGADPTKYRKYAAMRTGNGFLQVGYDANQFQTDIKNEISFAANNRHIGDTGYVVIIDGNGNVVSQTEGFEFTTIEDFGDFNSLVGSNLSDEVFNVTINEENYYSSFNNVEGYKVCGFYPETEAMANRDINLYINTFMEILVFGLIFVLIFILVKGVVVERLDIVNKSLAKISKGDLEEKVNVRSNAEFAVLSDSINGMVDKLKALIAEAAARMDKDLEMAKNIQHSALPSVFPAFPENPEFEIYATMDTAKEVGGDFYDFYKIRDNVINFMIADVSGKGVPAALFMMRAKTQVKTLSESGQMVEEAFTNANAALCEGNDADMFVTAWMARVNIETGKMHFANAGHNPPLVKRADGKFEYLTSRAGLVLAGMPGLKYRRNEMDLNPGDIIYIYTDGVTEATDAHEELYGEDRLINYLNSREFNSMEEICRGVKADVDKFVGEAPQFDDITMVAFKYNGPEPIEKFESEHVSVKDIPALTEFVETQLEKMGCPMKVIMQINIAIDEIYSNIAFYAYKGIEPGYASVEVKRTKDPNGIILTFTDDGVPYNPMKKEDPDTTLSAEERGIGGLGIFMVKKSMDEMSYEYKNDRNILNLRKNFESME